MPSYTMQLLSTIFLATTTAAIAVAHHDGHHRCSSHVKGKVFDRYLTIWMENTDFDKAAGDPNLAWLAKQGIVLENYYSVTHPSQPNYIASVGGDYFGMDNDDLTELPVNISSVVDLLEDKAISWGEYQEDMPSVGFVGNFPNPETKANDYVQKHNPLIMYGSVREVERRRNQIKPLTHFAGDLKAECLPQWSFITPNMTSDGHDTSVTVAGKWTRDFLQPLLKNKYFMERTLILVTFDENHTFSKENRVFSILLGGAVPKHLHGTEDPNFYNHYSEIATVSANWGLHTLGRYDVGANVFEFVGKHTHDRIRKVHGGLKGHVFLNGSYPGIFNSKKWAPQPVPNVDLVVNGRTVLPKIREYWEHLKHKTVYDGSINVPSSANPPKPVYPQHKHESH